MEGSQLWYKPHRLLGSCGVWDTLGVTRLRLVTPWVYPIHHSFLGVYLSHVGDGAVGGPRLALEYEKQNRRLRMSSDHWPRISTNRLSIGGRSREQKAGPSLDNTYFSINLTLVVCFGYADSFELDHFDQYFHRIFWLSRK